MRGRYSHNIDAKGRIFIPAKMRETFGENFVAAALMEPCICLYTEEGWKEMLQKLEQTEMTKSRMLIRYLSSNACDVQTDAKGRVVIQQHLLDHAGLEKGKEALVIGAGSNRAEIWDPDRYNELVGSMSTDKIFAEFVALGL